MTERSVILVDRIDARLQALNLTDRKASLRATGKPDTIRDIRRGKVSSRLSDLARALDTTVDYLEGRTDVPTPLRYDVPANPVPSAQQMAKDVPVFGTAIGADAAYWSEHGGDVAIEQTDLNTGEVIDYFRRPPGLGAQRQLYGLYIAGDSMAPAYESGQGILVDPKATPAIRDYVVVYLRDKTDEFASGVLIKRLVRRSTDWIELEQYNPPATFRLEKRQVQATHRVKPWDEAFGF